MTEPSQTFLTELGLKTFLYGFSATCSLIHPFPVSQLAPSLWLLSDAPRAKGNRRQSEAVAHHADPKETVETLRRERETVGRHVLCVMLDSPEDAPETRDAYASLGYRFSHSEPQFVLPLERHVDRSDYPIRRVGEESEAEAIRKAARDRLLLTEHLNELDAPIRLYGAFDGETPIGWVRSVRATSESNMVANLFVNTQYRRRGIGKSLMSALLHDDARYGVKYSALLSSEEGALFYPSLGYEQHGLLLIFTPPKSESENGGAGN
jgi:GNAT superfamily N-acetyltransferase